MKKLICEAVKEEALYFSDRDHSVPATSFLHINVGYPSTLYDGCSFQFHMDDELLKKTLDFLMSQVAPTTCLSDYVTADLFGNAVNKDVLQKAMSKVHSDFDEFGHDEAN